MTKIVGQTESFRAARPVYDHMLPRGKAAVAGPDISWQLTISISFPSHFHSSSYFPYLFMFFHICSYCFHIFPYVSISLISFKGSGSSSSADRFGLQPWMVWRILHTGSWIFEKGGELWRMCHAMVRSTFPVHVVIPNFLNSISYFIIYSNNLYMPQHVTTFWHFPADMFTTAEMSAAFRCPWCCRAWLYRDNGTTNTSCWEVCSSVVAVALFASDWSKNLVPPWEGWKAEIVSRAQPSR